MRPAPSASSAVQTAQTAIYTTSLLAPNLLGAIAIAAYSYMALVPVIQPPIMKALTTKKERLIRMDNLRKVSKTEKILFPIVVTAFVALLVPSAAPLIGSLMLGNLFRECGVTERLSKTAQNELMNIVVIFLGVSVGATAKAETFLEMKTLGILLMGVLAFMFGTAGGVLLAKFMNLFLPEGKKINPLIGSAGVSAVPMAARVSQKEAKGGPEQLPAHARHGSERCRCHRLRRRRRRSDCPVRIKEDFRIWKRNPCILRKPFSATRTSLRQRPVCALRICSPACEILDNMGYWSIECWGGATF